MNKDKDQGFNEQNRYEMRRRKRMNRVLNVSILAVGALILFFALQLFLPESQETAENDVSEPQQNEESESSENETTEEQTAPEQEQTAPDENQNTDNQQENQNQDNQQNENQTQDNSDSNESRSTEDSSSDDTDSEESDNGENTVSIPEGGGPDQGEWESIGTEQSGSFRHDFDSSSQNWAEMEAALRYAAGLGSGEAEIWRIENGGGSNQAVGYISTYENRQTPYRVTIEFVENEGWKPVNIERADSNPEL